MTLPCSGGLHDLIVEWGDDPRTWSVSATAVETHEDPESVAAAFGGPFQLCSRAADAITDLGVGMPAHVEARQGVDLLDARSNLSDVNQSPFGVELWALAVAWACAPGERVEAGDGDHAVDCLDTAALVARSGVKSLSDAWTFMASLSIAEPGHSQVMFLPPSWNDDWDVPITYWCQRWWRRCGYEFQAAQQAWRALCVG